MSRFSTRALFVGAALCSGLVVVSASAADLSTKDTVVEPYNAYPPVWTGFYAGAYVGYSRGEIDAESETVCDNVGGPITTLGGLAGLEPITAGPIAVSCPEIDIPAVPLPPPVGGEIPATQNEGLFSSGNRDTLKTDSVIVGGLFGYNNQISEKTVIGLEISGGYVGQDTTYVEEGIGAVGDPVLDPPLELNADIDREWDIHLSARAGYLMSPSTLLLIKGGLSLTDIEVATTLFQGDESFTFKKDDILLGAHVGLGIESQIDRNWLFRLEGQATWYESFDVDTGAEFTVDGGEFTSTATYEPSDLSAKASIIYKLN